MSELPQSWAWAPLSAITSDATQKVPAHDEPFEYIDIGSIDRDRKRIASPQPLMGKDAPSRARKQVRAGDTLVSMTRPNLNAVALVPDGLDGQVASTGFDVLRPRGVEPRWPFYLVRTQDFIDAMSSLVQGALYPAVRAKEIRAHVVPVAPANEQSRIADELDTLLARVNACNDRFDAVPALLKRFRQAVLAAATSGELSAGSMAEECDAQHSPLPPAGWAMTTIGAVATDLRYGTSKKCEYSSVGIGVLRIPNIADHGAIDVADLKRAEFDSNEVERLTLRAGDLLVIRSNGSVDLVGKTSIVTPREVGLLFAGYLMRLRVRPTDALPAFVRIWIAAPAQREFIERTSKSTSGVNNLNAEELRSLPLLLPPISEQTEIVRRVEALFALADRIEARCTAARTHAQRLAPQLLAKAFRGELVPQDPTDEPASALLARIAAERSAATTPVKTRPLRTPRAARAPKETAAMTKSRQDADVSGQPYLATHLRRLGGQATAELLFKSAELPVADFYKQLAWEVAQGHVLDGDTTLGARDAA